MASKILTTPLYFHTVGIEGCGHHFWWSYLDELLKIIAEKKGNIFYNNLHRSNLRKEVQDIYFKWNEFDKKTNDEPKEKLFNQLRKKVTDECDNVLMWNCDSYPTQIFRTPDQNSDFAEIYENLKDIMNFKYIVITRDFCKTVNARLTYNDDGSLEKHTTNMIDHLLWIEQKMELINKDDYITINYSDIYTSLGKLAKFLNIDVKICKDLYKKIFRKSKRVLPNNIKSTIQVVANNHLNKIYNGNIDKINMAKNIINMDDLPKNKTLDTTIKTKAKIALCYSGGLRTFKNCYQKIVSLFEKYGEVDLFISTWEKPCYTQVKKDTDIHAIEGDTKLDGLLSRDSKVTKKYLRTITNFKVIDIEGMDVIDNIIDISKNMEWSIMSPSRLICQYYKMKRCNKLKNLYEQKYNVKYDLCVRLRCDMQIESLPKEIDLNKIYINYHVYQKCKTLTKNMINEMIYISNKENMDNICKIYDNFMKIWWIKGYGEGVSYKHFKMEKLIKDCVPYKFDLSVHRANGNIENM